MRGYQIGGQLAEAQARLSAQAAESQRSNLLDQQRMAIGQQYNQMQMQQAQNELKQKQQLVDMQTKQAQQQFAAQQQFRQLVSSGMSPAQAMMQLGPLLGESAQGMAALSRFQTPETWSIKMGEGGIPMAVGSQGSFGGMFRNASLPQGWHINQAKVQQLNREVAQMEKELQSGDPIAHKKIGFLHKQQGETDSAAFNRWYQEQIDAKRKQAWDLINQYAQQSQLQQMGVPPEDISNLGAYQGQGQGGGGAAGGGGPLPDYNVTIDPSGRATYSPGKPGPKTPPTTTDEGGTNWWVNPTNM
jgi:hypothetical protein